MAKISARGAREIARWKSEESGATMVLTSDGRLLKKVHADAYHVWFRHMDLAKSNHVARIAGYRRVTTRS